MTSINVVYPKQNQKIFDDSSFIMGSLPNWQASNEYFRINGELISISEKGFFSHPVLVHRGKAEFHLQRLSKSLPPTLNPSPAEGGGDNKSLKEEKILTLEGVLPYTVLPLKPLAIHKESIQPAHDLWLSAGDTLSITCSASESATVTLSIPGLKENCLTLTPLSAKDAKSGDYLDTRQGIFAQMHWVGPRIPRRGAYVGQIPVSSLLQGVNSEANLNDLPLILTVSAPGQTPLRIELEAKLSILSAPIAATIQVPLAVTRIQAWDGARATPLPQKVRFSVDGLQNGWARMHFSGLAQSLYISMDDLALATTQETKPLQMPSLENIQVKSIGEHQTEVLCHFARGVAEDCPLQIQVQPLGSGKQRLILQFLYAECRCDFIHYPPISEALVEHIHWRAITPESMEVWVDLKGPLAGYSYELFEHGWRLRLKMLPVDWKQTKILLDPGHGGHESGSTGLDGHFEKDLNLLVAQKAKQAFEKEGFSHVYLSRTSDVDVSLKARGEAVDKFQADIVLSLHHNALPDGRNSVKERGVSTFYYHPFAKGLADSILHDLTQPSLSSVSPLEPLPALGTFYDSLYMTRIHQATAVLVEFGFFTSPQDYEKLIDPDFQAQEVSKLAHAVRNYCQSQ